MNLINFELFCQTLSFLCPLDEQSLKSIQNNSDFKIILPLALCTFFVENFSTDSYNINVYLFTPKEPVLNSVIDHPGLVFFIESKWYIVNHVSIDKIISPKPESREVINFNPFFCISWNCGRIKIWKSPLTYDSQRPNSNRESLEAAVKTIAISLTPQLSQFFNPNSSKTSTFNFDHNNNNNSNDIDDYMNSKFSRIIQVSDSIDKALTKEENKDDILSKFFKVSCPLESDKTLNSYIHKSVESILGQSVEVKYKIKDTCNNMKQSDEYVSSEGHLAKKRSIYHDCVQLYLSSLVPDEDCEELERHYKQIMIEKEKKLVGHIDSYYENNRNINIEFGSLPLEMNDENNVSQKHQIMTTNQAIKDLEDISDAAENFMMAIALPRLGQLR